MMQEKTTRKRVHKGMSLGGLPKPLQNAMHILALELGRPVAAVSEEAIRHFLGSHKRLPKGF